LGPSETTFTASPETTGVESQEITGAESPETTSVKTVETTVTESRSSDSIEDMATLRVNVLQTLLGEQVEKPDDTVSTDVGEANQMDQALENILDPTRANMLSMEGVAKVAAPVNAEQTSLPADSSGQQSVMAISLKVSLACIFGVVGTVFGVIHMYFYGCKSRGRKQQSMASHVTNQVPNLEFRVPPKSMENPPPFLRGVAPPLPFLLPLQNGYPAPSLSLYRRLLLKFAPAEPPAMATPRSEAPTPTDLQPNVSPTVENAFAFATTEATEDTLGVVVQYFTAVLARDAEHGIGLRFVHNSHHDKIVVSLVKDGGPAAKGGQIRPGDHLLWINEWCLPDEGVRLDTVLQHLSSVAGRIELHFSRGSGSGPMAPPTPVMASLPTPVQQATKSSPSVTANKDLAQFRYRHDHQEARGVSSPPLLPAESII
jgi:hypothetical protein